MPLFWLRAAAAYSAILVVLAVAPSPPVNLPDLLSHALASAVQALLFHQVLAPLASPLGSIAGAWLASTALGAGTEVIQLVIPWRTAELKDILADAGGAGAVLMSLLVVRRALGLVRRVAETAGVGPSSGAGSRCELMRDSSRVDRCECLHCRESIRAGATRCPHCMAWQSRWAGDSQNPRLELALLTSGVAVVALIVGGMYASEGKSRKPDERASFDASCLNVTGVRPVLVGASDRRMLAVVGTLKNRSTTAWRDPYLQVECVDRKGNVVETFSSRALNFVVPAKGIGTFKVVETMPLKDPSESFRCTVEVRWANRAE